MSAPRSNAAIDERMDEWREKKATQESFSANDIAFCREVSAALRKEPPAPEMEKEYCLDCDALKSDPGVPGICAAWHTYKDSAPPALPAEAEAVIAKLLQEADACSAGTLEDDADRNREAATLLRRYAQAVAEKDAEIARLTEAHQVAVEERATAREPFLRALDEARAEIARLAEEQAKENPVLVKAILTNDEMRELARLREIEARGKEALKHARAHSGVAWSAVRFIMDGDAEILREEH